jgi:hypothetical protein
VLSSTVVAYLEGFRRIDDVAATLGYISGKVMAGFTNRGGQEGIGMNELAHFEILVQNSLPCSCRNGPAATGVDICKF